MVDNRVSPPRIDEDARVERQNSLSLLELCTVPTGTGHYIPISHKIAPAVLAAIQFATIDENGSQRSCRAFRARNPVLRAANLLGTNRLITLCRDSLLYSVSLYILHNLF